MRSSFLALAAVLAGVPLATAQAASLPTLDDVVRPGMLRVPLPRLEARIGAARQVWYAGNGISRHSYVVGGCALDAYAREGRVESVAVPLTPDCTVDLIPFMPGRNFPTANRMTVGDFIAVAGPGGAPDAPGAFRSPCLVECRGDPTVSYLRRGDGAEDVEIEVSAAVDDSHSSAAADRFTRAVREREGDEYVRQARFSCDGRYAPDGVQAFSAIRVSHVRVGRGIDASEAWLLAKCPNLREPGRE